MERSQFSFRKLGLRSNPGAGGTRAVEISDMSPDPAVKSLSGGLHDGINTIHVQINNASAFRTHEMIMFGSISIKMVNTGVVRFLPCLTKVSNYGRRYRDLSSDPAASD